MKRIKKVILKNNIKIKKNHYKKINKNKFKNSKNYKMKLILNNKKIKISKECKTL